jgi:hypothetical protein
MLPIMADSTPLPAALRYLGKPSKPDPAAKLTSRLLQVTLSSDPPGYALSDRYEQTNHYTGVIYIALKAYMDSIGAAKFTVLERKSKGTVRKSLGMGNYSRDDEYEPADPDHPLCQILERPGGDDGVWSMGQECVYLTLQHMLTGDAPVWTPTNEDDRPVQFYSLTSALVSPMFSYANEQYPQGAYRVTPYTASGFYAGSALMTGAILPGEEVKRFRMPHPWARNLGMSPLQTGGREIDVLEAITMSRWSFFDHGLQLDTLVTMPGASDPQIDAFYEKLNQRNGGAKNARRVLVIGGSGAQDAGGNKFGVSQLGPTNREMDYGSSYDSAAAVVMALFRVPKQIGGLVEGTNYSADWAAQRRFYDLGTQPYARNLSVFLTQSLARPWCPKDDPGRFKIEVEVPEPRNLEEEAKERQFAWQNNACSLNEFRRGKGDRAVEGGDVPKIVWEAKAQQSVQPPEPPPGPDGAPEGDAVAADPLAALLGGGDQPTAGAVPTPDNPGAEGSGAPVAKAMSAYDSATGGALVPTAAPKKPKKKKNKRALIDKVLKSLEGEPVFKAAAHAPAGGVSVGGKEYRGGEFIPGDVMDRATDDEKAKVAGQDDPKGDAKGNTKGGARGALPDGDVLAGAPSKNLKASGDVRAVEHNGQKYVVKQAYNTGESGPVEELAAALAQTAGARAPKAKMTTLGGKPALVQEMADGRPLADIADESPESARAALAKVPRTELDRHVLFDYLLGNSDGHNGNFLVGDGTMTSIDKEMILDRGVQGQKFQPPHFVSLASADGGYSGYKFDPKSLPEMAAAGERMAKDLEQRGMKKAARQVRDRAVVLSKLAEQPGATVADLYKLAAKGVTPPNLGFFGKIGWALSKG